MRIAIEAPPLYFIHMPKTAGVALSKFLTTVYRESDIIQLWSPEVLPSHSVEEFRAHRCFICHFGFGLYDLARRPGLAGVTLLRDPVERAISEIFHHQRDLKHYPETFTDEYREQMAPYLEADLRTCLESAGFVRLIDNRQTRELGVSRDARPFFRELLLRPNEVPPASQELDMPAVLKRAKENLNGLSVVGLTEAFQEFLELLCATAGLPQPEAAPEANLGSRKQKVEVRGYRATTPPDVWQAIEDLNRYDLELYQHASQLFRHQLDDSRKRGHRSFSIAPHIRAWRAGGKRVPKGIPERPATW